jgi:hypothetical protein
VTLRNPSDHPQDFTASLTLLLELPDVSARVYTARRPWKNANAAQTLHIQAQEQHTFHLRPFQVMTLELVPSP